MQLDEPLDEKFMKKWFGAETLIDLEIKDLFSKDFEELSNNKEELAMPTNGLEGLAKIIVLDQFSRNIHRDTPGMYATDKLALKIAQHLVKEKLDTRDVKHPCMKNFIYLPFVHSEDLAVQDEGLRLYKEIYNNEPENSPFKGIVTMSLSYTEKHCDIVAQFGRFPHRNKILGRISTPEEEKFLASGGETFDPRTKSADPIKK